MLQEIGRYIPPDAATVVYFGCGDGSGMEALRQRYPRMTLVGMEQDPALRQQAQQYGFFVAENARMAVTQLALLQCPIDAWIIDRRAWLDETLSRSCRRQIASQLRPGATVVWDIANGQYWQHLLELIRGKTDGQSRYCVQDIVSEWSRLGIGEAEMPEPQSREKANEFPQFWQLAAPLVAALKLPAEQQKSTFQLDTVRLRGWFQMAEAKPLTTLTTVLGETMVCSRVRIDEPHEFLATLPNIICKRFETVQEASFSNTGRQVWIWQRRLFSYDSMVALQGKLLQRGALTIQEWDDDPLHWESNFQQSRFVELRSSHAIQTSTPALAEYFRAFNPEVAVFPNCIERLTPLSFSGGKTLGLFFGALNRQQDWAPIMPALNRILLKYKSRMKLVVVSDREFFDASICEQKEYVPFCSYAQYQELLKHSDIALLPLLPSRFNRMKSDLKFLECAAFGTAALASPTVYADTVVSGETGLLYETEAEFETRLTQLVEDATYRQRLVANAWEWVKENRLLSQHYRDRLDWYESLFDRYEELTVAIGERVPELRQSV